MQSSANKHTILQHYRTSLVYTAAIGAEHVQYQRLWQNQIGSGWTVYYGHNYLSNHIKDWQVGYHRNGYQQWNPHWTVVMFSSRCDMTIRCSYIINIWPGPRSEEVCHNKHWGRRSRDLSWQTSENQGQGSYICYIHRITRGSYDIYYNALCIYTFEFLWCIYGF